ncbi:hypothetical protein N9B82_01940 [Saprospiraceae bacterium]|nr:hypothetical protein [Saprospiraceae bacterium]
MAKFPVGYFEDFTHIADPDFHYIDKFHDKSNIQDIKGKYPEARWAMATLSKDYPNFLFRRALRGTIHILYCPHNGTNFIETSPDDKTISCDAPSPPFRTPAEG